ncbi:MAG: hypothetical protein WC673_01750 [Candidatus Paceibacterota bacterium]
MLPKIKKIFFAQWKTAIMIILVIFAGRAAFNIYGRYQDSRASLALIEKELTTIENKKTTLEKTTTALKTEEGIKEEIRQKYQVAQDGEQLIVIIDDEQKKPTETPEKRTGIWQPILKFFGLERN